MTQIDYDREMAFIAVRETTGETAGICRFVRAPYTDEAEFAILVETAWKGRGLARHLMERSLAWARTQGIREIIGQILAANAPMLAFIHRLGFTIHRMQGEPDLVEARLTLDA